MTRIVIFAKAPVAGQVKTRLVPALGEEGAARLAREMLRRTVSAAVATGLSVEVCASPAPSADEWGPYLPDVAATDQGGGDLGERLARAAKRVIDEGEKILLIGTDCPELDRDRLLAAARVLERHDAVIHPAEDGGYALLGLRRFEPSIFEDIAWSTASVAEATMARIQALGWSFHVGATLRDIDEPADLIHLPAMHSLPPYAELLGLSTGRSEAGELLWIMPFREEVVGRPGYLHGGAIAGLLEFAALGTLRQKLEEEVAMKPINVTVQFTRGGVEAVTYAAATVTRLGKRVANVEARAWQEDRSKPIASAQMNVMLKRD